MATRKGGCGCYLAWLCMQALIGWFLSDVFFERWFGKDLPIIADFFIGAIAAPILFIADIVGWAISFGMDDPSQPVWQWLMN